MHELNSFRNATFLNRLRSATRLTQQKGASQLKFQAGECSPDPSNSTSDIFLEEIESEMVEQFRLREILEEACLVTGATGAAIALARGKEMVCCANAGTDAPDLGVCLDLRHGLSGTCIQTRQLQQCTDTETDPRVDRQVCRQLGVRSLAVLPVLQGTELLGIFEILSSRPNAFGQGELDSLQALSCRILPRKLQEVEVTAKVSTKGSPSLRKSEEFDAQNKIHTPISDPGISHRHEGSKSRDLWPTILGMLVIGAAVTLGVLVGWRLGWKRQLFTFATFRPCIEQMLRRKPDRLTISCFRPSELPRSSTPAKESGHRAGGVTNQRVPGTPTKSRAHLPPGGGLTIHQGGKVIFGRLPRLRELRAHNPHAFTRSGSKSLTTIVTNAGWYNIDQLS